LLVDKVNITRIPEKTGLIGFVTDELTGRPIAEAQVQTTDGKVLATANANGSFSLQLPSGSVQVVARHADYAECAPIAVTVEAGRRKAINPILRRTKFGFGNVVSAIPCPGQNVNSLEVTADAIYYGIAGEDINRPIYRMTHDGKNAMRVNTARDLSGLVICRGTLFGLGVWPGRLLTLSDNRQELYQKLDINWPGDAAFDGSRLWYIEHSTIDGRFGLHVFDLETRRNPRRNRMGRTAILVEHRLRACI
jgi:hypothetical protein